MTTSFMEKTFQILIWRICSQEPELIQHISNCFAAVCFRSYIIMFTKCRVYRCNRGNHPAICGREDCNTTIDLWSTYQGRCDPHRKGNERVWHF
jgi:hypothetical protein